MEKNVCENKPRGYFEEHFTHDDICIMQWNDNRSVTVASNCYTSKAPDGEVKKDKKVYNRAKKSPEFIDYPYGIKAYNRQMFGVDKADQLLAYYPTARKSIKFYNKLAFNTIDIVVNNSWIISQKSNIHDNFKKEQLMYFKAHLGLTLMQHGSLVALPPVIQPSIEVDENEENGECRRASEVPEKLRMDGYKHNPEFRAATPLDRKRCRVKKCQLKSNIYCDKCKVPLCVSNTTNCWKIWHYTKDPVLDGDPPARKRKAGKAAAPPARKRQACQVAAPTARKRLAGQSGVLQAQNSPSKRLRN